MPIVFDQVTFTYLHTRQPALKDIDLTFEDGTITAVIGEVGAGKSTLLRMMNGIVPNHLPGYVKGKVLVDGVDTQSVEITQLASKVNLVFDDPVLQIVSLTVQDDVQFGPANLGLPPSEINARVEEALRRTRLNGYEKRNPRTLSGGEQQLLAIAGMLAMRSKYLVLDDPIAMLDPVGKSQVLEAIRDLHRDYGVTVVISESGADIEAVLEIVDRVVVLGEGRVWRVGPPGEVLADQRMVEAVHLRVPQVTQVAYSLGAQPAPTVPVTLKEGSLYLRRLFKPGVKVAPPPRGPRNGKASGIPAVFVRALWHTFSGPPEHTALQGVDLEIPEGDLVALLGQNGAGKTTLAFHMVGALRPTNREAVIRIAGLDLAKAPQFDLIQKINYVFQNPANQLFCDTFAQEASYGPERLGLPPAEVERRARSALAKVGLENYWAQETFDIPKSLETLLGMASVLSLEPKILIVDEPTGGLDLNSARRVMETLAQLNRESRTIVMITHDMALAARYAKRILVLNRGQIFADGSTREIFSRPTELAQARLQPPQITLLGQSLGDLGLPSDVLTVEEFVPLVKPALVNGEVG